MVGKIEKFSRDFEIGLVSEARAKAKDPVQEHLREHKDQWNKRTKQIIDAFKSVKKGINGYPVPPIGLSERSKITSPVPDQLVNATKQIEQYFAEAFADLNSIINEQAQYAQYNAEKHQQRRASLNQSLVKEALDPSNPFSRTLTYMKSPFSSERWERKNMLLTAVSIEDKLKDLETLAVSTGDKTSIPELVNKTKAFTLDFLVNLVKPTIELIKKKSPEIIVDNKIRPFAEPPPIKDIKYVIIPVSTLLEYVNRVPAGLAKMEGAPGKKYEGKYRRSGKIGRILHEYPFDQTKFYYVEELPDDMLRVSPARKEESYKVTKDQEIQKPILDHEEQVKDEDRKIKDMHRQMKVANKKMRESFSSSDENEQKLMQKSLDKLSSLDAKFSTLKDRSNPDFSYSKLANIYLNFMGIIASVNENILKKEEEPIIAEAADSKISRWYKRQMLSVFTNQEKRHRKTATEALISARKSINAFMYAIEKNSEPIVMAKALVDAARGINDAIDSIADLGRYYNTNVNIARHNAKAEGEKAEVLPLSVSDIRELEKYKEQLGFEIRRISIKDLKREMIV